MSMTSKAQLCIGFEVYPTDLYTISQSEIALCDKGHHRPDAHAKFCSQDGTQFAFRECIVPTPLFLKIAQHYNWMVEQDTDWEQKFYEIVSDEHLPFLDAATVRGEGSDHQRPIIGMCLDSVSGHDYRSVHNGHDLKSLQKITNELTALRDNLGFPQDREIQIFLSLYYG